MSRKQPTPPPPGLERAGLGPLPPPPPPRVLVAETNASITGLQKKLERVRGVLANQLKRDSDARWEALDILNDKE